MSLEDVNLVRRAQVSMAEDLRQIFSNLHVSDNARLHAGNIINSMMCNL